LKNVTDVVDRYLNGKTSVEEVESFWGCTKYAVRTFRDKVEGSTPGGYTARELRDFIQRYFLGGDDPDAVQINDELLNELMQIKRIFVGGGDRFISYSELDRTFTLIDEFRAVSVSLHPYILIITKRVEGVPAPSEVDAGAERFIEGMRRLGS